MINSTLKITQLEQFSSINVNGNNQGVIATATAGTTTNIDLKLVDDCFITGGVLRTNAATFGDHATFQVIDIDNILGYGANTILGQYNTNWYMCSDRQTQVDENSPYPAKILANLYLRVKYTSIGSTDVIVCLNYRLHKALY
jgi:hypothetical protein